MFRPWPHGASGLPSCGHCLQLPGSRMPAVLGVFPTKRAAVSIPGSQILFRLIQCVPLIALDKETMYIFL